MPEADRKLRVFLCHASQDKPAVRELYQRLKKEGWIDPWLDEEKLTFGQHWTTVIEDALHEADIVIIFLSHNSVQKEGFVQRELNYAWEISLEKPRHVIFLIPFRLDDCEIPRYLGSRQWGDYFGEKKEGTYQILLRSLKQRHEQKLQLEAEERARLDAEERKRQEAEELKRKQDEEAKEKVRLDALEKERLEAEERKRKQAEEKERKEKEARERKAEVERARKAAEEQAKKEKEARERKAPEPKKPQTEKPVDQPVEYKVSPPAQRGDSYRPEKRPSYALYLGGAGVLVTLFCLIFGVNYLIQNVFAKETPTPTSVTPLFTVTATPMRTASTQTIMPAPTKTSIPPIPTLGIGSTMVSTKDGMVMVYVPAGEFEMGSTANLANEECQKFLPGSDTCIFLSNKFRNEEPTHKITLNGYWIDKTEVTNVQYAECVQDEACSPPDSMESYTVKDYYGNTDFDNYPVIYVSWKDANDYCAWAGRRLPTESEWEKAAGWDYSVGEKRTYPWGNAFDGKLANTCDKNCPFEKANMNYDDGQSDIAPVGSYIGGASPYGTLNMAGNVWEWVMDWYDVYPGGDPTVSEDFGQVHRVIRGGAWDVYYGFVVRVTHRLSNDPLSSDYDIGFRCARSE